MAKNRNYWIYSLSCFVVWAILLALVGAKRNSDTRHNLLLVFGGWAIAWVSTTIARFVYPPPRRWLRANTPAP
jgi:membrane-associated phospholipid phosphatase